MAESLSPQCTPLKKSYDSCFNTWFESYLEPASKLSNGDDKQTRAEFSKMKADEFQSRCGKVWEEYKACIDKSLKEKDLHKLLDQAREEHPLKDPIPPLPEDKR